MTTLKTTNSVPVSQSPGHPGRGGAGAQGQEHQQRVGQGGLSVVSLESLFDDRQEKTEVFSEAAAEDIEHEGGENKSPGKTTFSWFGQSHLNNIH